LLLWIDSAARWPEGCIGQKGVFGQATAVLIPVLLARLQEEAMADYLTDVKKYDAGASADVVAKIVKHLGIALRNRDSSLVSCTDQKELDRVKAGWIAKKLGVADAGKADSALQKVCQEMAADNTKHRVTFYYLVAKNLNKLGSL
jgi:hypothetical protein